MPSEFVETVRIQNFGCVRDATLELTRLHALIGPNDSGKSTVLAALQTACGLTQTGSVAVVPLGSLDSQVSMSWHVAGVRRAVELRAQGGKWDIQLSRSQDEGVPFELRPAQGAMMVRWDPDSIRRASELVPEGRPLKVDERGDGIAAVYDAVLSRDRVAFDEIEARVRRLFPTIKSIWLPTSAGSKKSLGVILNDGTRVHANAMSEGLLYWLAFAILPQISRTAFVLVEEPENGLHPSRITEVMSVLRDISTSRQVIIATHSPLVINELQPEEVTILTRTAEQGTRATRIDRTTHFQQREKVYALGELWLSFADGSSEAALVPPQT